MYRFLTVIAALMILSVPAYADTDSFPFDVNASCSGPLTATTTSQTYTSPFIGLNRMIISDAGTTTVYFASGQGSATATINNMPVLAGGTSTFTKKPNHDRIAYRADSGTDVIYICIGSGL